MFVMYYVELHYPNVSNNPREIHEVTEGSGVLRLNST